MDATVSVCHNLQMASQSTVRLRAATPDDDGFVVEMTRHACVIEDRLLPDPDDDEVLEMLRTDAAGAPLPELCIGVAPERRGTGIGGLLLDALFADLARGIDTMCTNVHVRNPAKRLYERKGFRVVGQGNGSLGLAMIKDLR